MPMFMPMSMLILAFCIHSSAQKRQICTNTRPKERANNMTRQAERSRAVKWWECQLAFSLCLRLQLPRLSSVNIVDFENSSTCSREKRRKQQWLYMYVNVCVCLCVCAFVILHLIFSRLIIRRVALHGSLSSSTVFRHGERERRREKRERERRQTEDGGGGAKDFICLTQG